MNNKDRQSELQRREALIKKHHSVYVTAYVESEGSLEKAYESVLKAEAESLIGKEVEVSMGGNGGKWYDKHILLEITDDPDYPYLCKPKDTDDRLKSSWAEIREAKSDTTPDLNEMDEIIDHEWIGKEVEISLDGIAWFPEIRILDKVKLDKNGIIWYIGNKEGQCFCVTHCRLLETTLQDVLATTLISYAPEEYIGKEVSVSDDSVTWEDGWILNDVNTSLVSPYECRKIVDGMVHTARYRHIRPSTKPQGVKYDSDKPDWSLLPLRAVEEVVKVLTFGAKKYSPDNWRKVDNLQSRYFAASMRHEVASRHEDSDPETGLHHLAHKLCCDMFRLEDMLLNKQAKGDISE